MRCRNCKDKFEPKYFNQKFCLKDECVRAFVEFTKAKEWTKKKKELKKELETVQDLMKIAQKVFNQYIRLRDKGKPCISCGCEIKGAVNASHYYSAGNHYAVRFDEDNVHSSCVRCNMYLSGNLEEYSRRLPKRIGEKAFEELQKKSKKTASFTREELRELIKYYKQKIKDESK